MADTNVQITAGAGTSVDTRTTADGDHRQVTVTGDGATSATQTVKASGEAVIGFTNPVQTGTLTAADAGSVSASGYANTGTYTGTPTTGSAVAAALDGATSVAISVTGTFSQNLVFEKSYDAAATWVPAPATLVSGSTTELGRNQVFAPVITANTRGFWAAECAGATHLRVRCTGYTSGTANVRLAATASPGPQLVTVVNAPRPYASSSATLSNVAASATSVFVLSLNASRLAFTVTNDSQTAYLYLAYSSTVSVTSYTVALAPGQAYQDTGYSGYVSGIWIVPGGGTPSGNARVTDIT